MSDPFAQFAYLDARERFEHPDYGTCVVALYDALREYLRCSAEIHADLMIEGSLTADEARESREHHERAEALLKEIEGFNPVVWDAHA